MTTIQQRFPLSRVRERGGKMNYARCRATHFLSTSSMRVCQPAPVDLKYSTTSRLYRTVTESLVSWRCGPRSPDLRLGSTASNSFGNTSCAGRARFMSSRVSSRTSPFSLISGFVFIASNLPAIRLPKTDDTNPFCYVRKTNHMQPGVQIPQGNEPPFAVSTPGIFPIDRCFPIEVGRSVERQVACLCIALRFCGVELDSHAKSVVTNKCSSKLFVVTKCGVANAEPEGKL